MTESGFSRAGTSTTAAERYPDMARGATPLFRMG
jgi:hypothetical protein